MSSEEDRVYNLSENYVTVPESTSVYMTTPEGRSEPDSLKINRCYRNEVI